MDDYPLEPVTPPPPPPPAAQAQRTLEHDHACVRCGYNLRGLPFTGRCPECGISVEHALMGDLLRFSSPAYVAALRRGVTIVFAGILTYVGLILCMIVLASHLDPPASDALASVASWLSAAVTIAIAGGWWLFSTPDPAILTLNTGSIPRLIVRIAAAASACGSLAVAALQEVPALIDLRDAGSTLHGIAIVVVYVSSLLYVAWIARRLPDPDLARDAKRLTWLGPAVWILLFCIVIGPLVALGMYLFVLNRVRLALASIVENQRRLQGVT